MTTIDSDSCLGGLDAAQEAAASDAAVVSPQKQAVLDFAKQLFVQRGYEGVSIRDIAQECGLAKATIYHHFRDKEDLFFSVLEYDLLTLHTQVMQVVRDDQPTLTKLRAAIEAYYNMLRDRRTGVVWSIHENAQLKVPLQKFFKRNMRLILDPWLQILGQGVAEGVFRPLDVQLTALSLLAMLNTTVLYQTHFREDIKGDDLVEHIYNLFVQGVLQA